MVKVKVFVTLRESVVDPQGTAVQKALHSMGYKEVQETRIGKYMELTLEETSNLDERVKEMCERILANPVIEDFHYEVLEESVSK
ncbi:phosphoribosylformylglycinamidine synthase [Bacillus coahuilensis m2-6]|uniref:Phosphoribosylformylglycinamidine synthase subunit PurS n=1 Tax=Bacillus coahuilensis p1.1.43 TaxID=1150625 RepID=A0A147KC84_9BACI|nr:phosphoribosylformylglycinamidine synthase subunit PurS [Bacillus coahuilensis]KUP09223.1 phosphoribosylformylglycinamidine synthase [Bacillus coahuilensis p1.1.43]KUP09948.1 phosphoribosylformylglycinamidine synthase [Bacillus coahuilensis m2-6]